MDQIVMHYLDRFKTFFIDAGFITAALFDIGAFIGICFMGDAFMLFLRASAARQPASPVSFPRLPVFDTGFCGTLLATTRLFEAALPLLDTAFLEFLLGDASGFMILTPTFGFEGETTPRAALASERVTRPSLFVSKPGSMMFEREMEARRGSLCCLVFATVGRGGGLCDITFLTGRRIAGGRGGLRGTTFLTARIGRLREAPPPDLDTANLEFLVGDASGLTTLAPSFGLGGETAPRAALTSERVTRPSLFVSSPGSMMFEREISFFHRGQDFLSAFAAASSAAFLASAASSAAASILACAARVPDLVTLPWVAGLKLASMIFDSEWSRRKRDNAARPILGACMFHSATRTMKGG